MIGLEHCRDPGALEARSHLHAMGRGGEAVVLAGKKKGAWPAQRLTDVQWRVPKKPTRVPGILAEFRIGHPCQTPTKHAFRNASTLNGKPRVAAEKPVYDLLGEPLSIALQCGLDCFLHLVANMERYL